MTDHELLARVFETVGRIDERTERTERKLDDHISDDERRFRRLDRKDRELAEDVEEVTATGRAKALSSHDAVAALAVEGARTERWKIVGGIVAGALAVLGAILGAYQGGRANAPPPAPYAVPTNPR
jgi:hypothetical protein